MARLGGAAAALLLVCGFVRSARAQAADGEGLVIALHGRLVQAVARVERAAWISLSLPFDKLAAPRIVRPSQAKAEEAAAPAPPSAPVPAPPSAPPASAAEPNDPAVEPALTFTQLKRFADFSSAATRVALSVAGAAGDRRRLDSLSTRARLSAALPELRLRVLRSNDQALRYAPVADDPYRATQADGAGTILEASATFRLDRLAFSRDELAVERLRIEAGAERIKLEQRVAQGLLALYRARELACLPDASDEARAEQRVRLVQLFSELELLTAGWFGEHAAGLSRAIWGFPEAVLAVCRRPQPEPEKPATKPVASLSDSE